MNAIFRRQIPANMKLWPFSRRPFLDVETSDWHQSNFRWLIATFGAQTNYVNRELVVPSPQMFKTGGLQGHALALYLLEQVKNLAGMTGWEVELVADESGPPEYEGENLMRPVHGKYAAGTFSVADSNHVRISYASNSLSEPHTLISTFAHELGHYLLATSPEKLPVPEDEQEFLTDLTAVFLGFGTFMCNSVFQYEQFQDGVVSGWKWQRLGYLPEDDMVYGTALFLKSRNLSADVASKYLKPHLAKKLARALVEVKDLNIGAAS